ncbi:MAG: DsbA family protein [Polyangiales bacterium]
MKRATVVAAIAIAACGPSTTPKTPGQDGDAIVTLSGVDTSELTLEEKRTFSKIVQTSMSPCGEPITVSQCVQESRGCRRCTPAAKAAVAVAQHGFAAADGAGYLKQRFADESVKVIDLTGAPRLGPADARVTVVEFVDFECPHCAKAAPIVRSIVEKSNGAAALYYRGFPLPFHAHAEPAARAALAAAAQGQFWPFAEQLFLRQDDLGDPAIEAIARGIAGLDVAKWKTAWASTEIATQVTRDKDQAGALGINGTPTVYVDGHKFVALVAENFEGELNDWVSTAIASRCGSDARASQRWRSRAARCRRDRCVSVRPRRESRTRLHHRSTAPRRSDLASRSYRRWSPTRTRWSRRSSRSTRHKVLRTRTARSRRRSQPPNCMAPTARSRTPALCPSTRRCTCSADTACP